MKYSKIVTLVFLMVCQFQYAQFTDQINSNRPGKSQGAFSVGKTILQTEMGINYVSEKHKTRDYSANGFLGEIDFRYGLFFEQLEFSAEIQYQTDKYESDILNQNRSALKKTILGAKYLFYDPFKNYEEKVNLYSWKANNKFKWRQFLPAVAIYGGANFNFSDNPFNYAPKGFEEPTVSPKVMLIAQNHFGTRWVMVTNVMYDKIATDLASINYVVTITRGFNAKWSGFIENQGYFGDYYSDGVFRLGAAYLLKNNMQLDASFGKNIKDTPGLLTGGIGFSWRFEKNYKEVQIEKNKGSKMDKKKQKQAEQDKKKRKDAVETE